MVFPGSILSTWPPFLSRSRGTRKRGKTFHSREAGSPILDTLHPHSGHPCAECIPVQRSRSARGVSNPVMTKHNLHFG
jgi:hypothetical protein